jgi:hypothetical protein
MKRVIFLKTAYKAGPDERAKAFKIFKEELKKLPQIKALQEIEPPPQVIVEFADDKYQELYDALRVLDIVELIDSILPSGAEK